MPADRQLFDHHMQIGERLFGKDVPWCVAGIGPAQVVLNGWAVSSDGHALKGLEETVRINRDTPAPFNAALVARVEKLCDKNQRPVADWRQARQILGPNSPQAA